MTSLELVYDEATLLCATTVALNLPDYWRIHDKDKPAGRSGNRTASLTRIAIGTDERTGVAELVPFRIRRTPRRGTLSPPNPISTIAVLGLACACLSACAELKVEPDVATMQADTLPKSDSLTYNLSETTITVSGSVTLNDCDSVVAAATQIPPEPASNKPPAPVPPPVVPAEAPPIDISESFTVSVSTQADPRYQYQIPFKNLEGWTKQLNLAVARNSNKTLVSINGTITDQAGPTILAAAQAAITIGGAIALPAVAPVTAAALANQAAGAASKQQMILLSEMSDQEITKDMLPSLLDLKSVRDKVKWQEIFDQVATLNAQAARLAAVKAIEARKATEICSPEIHKALEDIATQQRQISKANSKPTDQASQPPPPGSTGTNTSAAPQPNPIVTKAQARIAAISAENHLTRQFTGTWTPTRDELAGAPRDGGLYIMTSKIELFEKLVSVYWLSSDGVAYVKSNPDKNVVLSNLTKPLVVQLFIRPWTVGRDFYERTLDGQPGTPMPRGYRSGIVYRDPALSLLRTCLDVCGGALIPQPPGATPKNPALIAPGVATSEDLDNDLVETTTDVSAPILVPIVQLGRLYVQPLRNVLFQTSAAALTVGTDGSIASVGTQSSSAAAAGFTAAGGAATAQANAIAARNTAVAAQNTAGAAQTTATTAAATFADTVNKALADCLTQQAAIVKAGGRPVACQ
jgi:hypothetical protein